MATVAIAGTFGSDDPTRATAPFVTAVGAIEAGHEPRIVLIGEAVYLMKDVIAEQIQAVGFPKMRDLLSQVIEHKVPVYV